MMQNAKTINEWADQKKREDKQQAAQEAEDERCYAAQQQAINRMKGMLEDEMAQKRANMNKQIQDENKRLAREKREREAAWKQDQEESNQFEVTLTNHHEELQADGKIFRHQ